VIRVAAWVKLNMKICEQIACCRRGSTKEEQYNSKGEQCKGEHAVQGRASSMPASKLRGLLEF
jgi:hypothetical protein